MTKFKPNKFKPNTVSAEGFDYAWLFRERSPRMICEAVPLIGIEETDGPANTPEIMRWADELGPDVRRVYTGDSIPWCGLFMAIVAKRAGKPIPASPLWARAWASWGTKSHSPSLGDVLVFSRDDKGHVGLYVGHDDAGYFHALGGNQGDAVSIKRIPSARLIAARQHYKIGQPPSVRPILLAASGDVTTGEA